MRCLAVLLFFATPAAAWEFRPTPICTLTDGATTVTFDGQTYTIAIERAEGWPPAPFFEIQFNGPRGFTIGTDRHQIDGTSLSVSDTGFGNVLNGLQFSPSATAIQGAAEHSIDLTGAADPTAQFRLCDTVPTS